MQTTETPVLENSLLQTLSSSELAALARGLEVTTEQQLAVCYLAAHHSVLETKVSFGININHDDLSVEVGMNPETYRRTFNKFRLIINDQHEDEEFTNSEHVYPKIINAHGKFINMPYNEVMEIAKEAFTPEAKEEGQRMKNEFLERNRKGSAKRAKAKKENENAIVFKVNDLYNTLKVVYKNDFKKAEKNAISKVATETGQEISEIKKMWDNFRKNE